MSEEPLKYLSNNYMSEEIPSYETMDFTIPCAMPTLRDVMIMAHEYMKQNRKTIQDPQELMLYDRKMNCLYLTILENLNTFDCSIEEVSKKIKKG